MIKDKVASKLMKNRLFSNFFPLFTAMILVHSHFWVSFIRGIIARFFTSKKQSSPSEKLRESIKENIAKGLKAACNLSGRC